MLRFPGCARNKLQSLTAMPKPATILLGAGLSKKCMLVLCIRKYSHSDAKGNLQRPMGKRRSLPHPFDILLFDLVHHIPSNIPESSFQTGYSFMQTTRRSFALSLQDEAKIGGTFLEPTVLTWTGCLYNNFDNSMSIGYVHTTKQLAQM